MEKLDIIERLEDDEMYVDAIDDAIEEISSLRGLVLTAIESYDNDYSGTRLENAIEELRKYMHGDNND